jgi:anti-sigma regulatory factor (Ser/Thr protein kinase)
VDVQVNLDPDPRAPTLARAAVDRLEGRVDLTVLHDLRLVVSELVTNAIVHGPRREPVRLRLRVLDGGCVAGEVADQGEDGAIEVAESAGDGGGWGLRLVDQLTDRWGVYEGSTHVWFELSARAR